MVDWMAVMMVGTKVDTMVHSMVELMVDLTVVQKVVKMAGWWGASLVDLKAALMAHY